LDAINIAHPATLVIDGGGIVRYVYRGSNRFDRATVEPVLAVVN
jgi:peroxiredoxin